MTPRHVTDLTHSLVAGLKDMISGGALRPGSRFPPERELAKRFGVNRASIRQALKALDVMGVVYQRVGDGTYLTQDASSTLTYPLEFLVLMDGITEDELLDARMIVEPELAARAATRATSDQIAALEKMVKDEEAAVASGAPEAADHDFRFHEWVWRASGSRVCDRMFASIHRVMAQKATHPDIHAHHGITAAIKSRDEDAARREMRKHLLGNAEHHQGMH